LTDRLVLALAASDFANQSFLTTLDVAVVETRFLLRLWGAAVVAEPPKRKPHEPAVTPTSTRLAGAGPCFEIRKMSASKAVA
jgi:hypothetical protein